MHKEWCGKSCADCATSCRLDESMPCSPDCEFLGENGETDSPECQSCDALLECIVPVSFDGHIVVRATSAETARDQVKACELHSLTRVVPSLKVCKMHPDEIMQRADGSWAVEDAEATE